MNGAEIPLTEGTRAAFERFYRIRRNPLGRSVAGLSIPGVASGCCSVRSIWLLRPPAPESRSRVARHRRPRICGAGLLAIGVLASAAAYAQTDEIQVYDAEIAAPGQLNLTWHNNYTFAGPTQPAYPGGVVPSHELNGVPEWGYGVTPWFEAGLYLPVYTLTNQNQLLFDSAKLRALFVVPDARDRRFFYGINFELSYNEPHWEPTRFSGEIRPIVGAHLGHWDLIFNPILDTDFEGGVGNLEFAPATRVAYNVNKAFAVALEEYAEFGTLQHFLPTSQRSHTLFAVLDFGNSSSGLEFGVGKGLTAATEAWVVKLMLMHDL